MADAGQGPHKTTKHTQRRSNVDRSAATRSRILDATIRALYELGYGAVTNHIVAELAGVSRGPDRRREPAARGRHLGRKAGRTLRLAGASRTNRLNPAPET